MATRGSCEQKKLWTRVEGGEDFVERGYRTEGDIGLGSGFGTRKTSDWDVSSTHHSDMNSSLHGSKEEGRRGEREAAVIPVKDVIVIEITARVMRGWEAGGEGLSAHWEGLSAHRDGLTARW